MQVVLHVDMVMTAVPLSRRPKGLSPMFTMKLLLPMFLLVAVVVAGKTNDEKSSIADSTQDSTATHHELTITREQTEFSIDSSDAESSVVILDKVSHNLDIWPFHGKNNTDEDHSCASHTSCFDCSTSSYLCHWCSHDSACHAVGSVHGCVRGADCGNHTKPDRKKDKNETACSIHATCAECALSSTLCHWCAHDQACHSVGSVYGCLTGVNCYSNDRCQRAEPELISGLVFPEMGLLPIVVILMLACMCCCCSTLGYCVAGGVKGAYDDLAHMASQPSHPHPSMTRPPAPAVQELPRDEENAAESSADEDADQEATPLLANGDQEVHDGYNLMSTEPQVHPFVNSPRRPASKHMQCLFRACTFCYVVTLITVGGLAVGGIRYYPKFPEYNICNDDVAWKSLVDSMAAMKLEAHFEILMSVVNPNHFDVAVDMGRGGFKHDGVPIGRFEIPPTNVRAMSITDLAIVATFTPEKWEALSLTTEYYRGTLVLELESQASIRVPMLANYSFEADVSNMIVHVNDPKMYDRHLCSCPDWKEAKNHTPFIGW